MRLPPARPRVVVPLAGLVCVAGAILLAAGAGHLAWVDAVQLLALSVVAALIAGLGVVVRRLYIQVGRLRANLAEHGDRLDRTVEKDRAELLRRASATTDALRDLREAQRVHSDRLTSHVTRQGRHDYAQHVAWQELREYLGAPPFMPPLRGWAASPDVLRLLVERIRDHRPKLVVECGSGASSVWLGYALRRAGEGRLVALEHEERYAELSRALVAEHRLDGIVEVRYAPLREWTPPADGDQPERPAQPWYELEAVADLTGIDLLFVDGPPAATAEEARYPAGPVLLPRCSREAVVVLDDTGREAERSVSDHWLAADPELERTEIGAEKGAHLFTWRRS